MATQSAALQNHNNELVKCAPPGPCDAWRVRWAQKGGEPWCLGTTVAFGGFSAAPRV